MTAVTNSVPASAQTGRTTLEQTVYQFVNAVGEQDVHEMHDLLHEKFQSVEKLGILSKTDYMKMLGDRRIGGVELQSQILSVDLAETSASLKVRLSGSSERGELFIHLCKNDFGSWQVLHVLSYTHQKM